MCNFTTDYEMMLASLQDQNSGWYKDGDWNEVKIEERLDEDDRLKVIDVISHEVSFYFDMEGRFIDIVNYKW